MLSYFSGVHYSLGDHDQMPIGGKPADINASYQLPVTEFIVLGINKEHPTRIKEERHNKYD